MSYQPLNDPEQQTPRQTQFSILDPNIERMREQDQKIKTRVRRIRIVIRVLALGCS